ncbi:MAG: outer membrane lipoprotein carrier protein LolA [Amphiplicatus sp.]
MPHLALLSAMIVLCADAGAARAAPPPSAVADAAPAIKITRPAPVETAPKAASAALVFASESDEAVVERVLSYLDAVTTFTADFTQFAPSGAMSTGKFYLRRPGLLRFEYNDPSPLLIVATGGTVFVRDEALETTDSYPVGKTPLKFLLRKKVDFGDFEVKNVDRGVDSVAVTFASSDEDDAAGEISIILKAPALELSEWIVRDEQNGVTTVSLNNVTEGASIANRLFAAPRSDTPFLKN